MYFLYSVLFGLALVLASPYFLLKGLRHNKYLHSLRARLGAVPEGLRQAAPGALWVHAVSVGEVLAVAPLVKELRARFPARKLFVSTTTRTGQEMAQRRLACDGTLYFPLDFAFACRRALDALQPAIVVIAETEIWPNFFRETRRHGARLLLVNGRLSDRSFRGYRLWRFFLRRALAQVDFFLLQSAADASRLRELGAPPERVAVGGNLKFDLPEPAPSELVAELERLAQGAPIVVAGSTLAREEEQLLNALHVSEQVKGRRPILVLAPRHPERFEEVARWLEARGTNFVRRSHSAADGQWRTDGQRPEVVLLDTMGELAGAYGAATVAFVGGSLVPAGGHNPIEPALWGKPVVFGPSMENFRSVAGALLKVHGAFQVRTPDELGILLATLLGDPAACQRAGAAARAAIERERGATARCADRIAALLEPPPGAAA